MKINIERENLLLVLQSVANVVERRQTQAILSNVLISAEGEEISLSATDLEVEVVGRVAAKVLRAGALTVPGRKLLDICRSLPALSLISLEEKDKRIRIQTGRSKFVLSTLPANEFPSIGFTTEEFSFELDAGVLQELIANTQFAMAHQDVRYYLNGLLFEITSTSIKAVATDGHRLALCERPVSLDSMELPKQVIVPRKGVTEIQRLAGHSTGLVSVSIASNVLKISNTNQSLTVKLVDGKFPDYERVLPKGGNKLVVANREIIRSALHRTSILSNEKFRGVRLNFSKNVLKTSAHNPEQEEAEEEIEIAYGGESLEIGFNVSYLLDVLSVLQKENIQIVLSDSNSSCLIQTPEDLTGKYVVMPMRL